jgi:hypothetical protein
MIIRIAVFVASFVAVSSTNLSELTSTRMKRTSGFAPASIGSLAIWFDASDSSSILDVNGLTVTSENQIHTWKDKSGNGVDVTNQFGDKPVLVADSINGQSVVRFTATGKLSGTQLRGSQSLGAGSVTYFVVYRWRALHNVYAIDDVITFGSEFDGGTQRSNSVSGSIFSDSSNDAFGLHGVKIDGPAVVLGETVLVCVSYDSATQLVSGYRHNVLLGQQTGVAGSLPSQIILGSWDATWVYGGSSPYPEYFGDADIAEVIVYNEALSDTERNDVHSYLSAKYGTAAAQPLEAPSAPPTVDPSASPTFPSTSSSISEPSVVPSALPFDLSTSAPSTSPTGAPTQGPGAGSVASSADSTMIIAAAGGGAGALIALVLSWCCYRRSAWKGMLFK